MKEFLTQHFELIIGIIVVGLFIIKAATMLKKAKKIDREGLETDAVVSRVEEIWDPETHSSSYTTYVEYKDEDGVLRESPMTLTQNVEYERGESVRIRFIPGEHKLVRPVK